MKNYKIIEAIFLKAKQPTKVKYTILHDNSSSGAKKFKIICQSPSKPLPFTFDQIENLDEEQVIKLQTMLELRRRKKQIEKQRILYNKLFASLQNNKQ